MKKRITIADNIRLIRESLGYSQDFIAAKLNLTQQAYSSIEKAPEKTTLKRLKEIAAVLQVNLVTLLGEDEVYILQKYNQSGGNAATQMNITPSTFEREVYVKLVEELKEQNNFLKTLVSKK